LAQDDVYKGHLIPKGATVVENVWSIFHDTVTFPEPQVFKPERFLKDRRLDASVKNPEDQVFGSSRRICPGRHFASRTIFLRIAVILATLNIEPGGDSLGFHIFTPQLPTRPPSDPPLTLSALSPLPLLELVLLALKDKVLVSFQSFRSLANSPLTSFLS